MELSKQKYFAKKVEMYGMKFDSKLELACYQILLGLEITNKIKNLRKAPTFTILECSKYKNAYTQKNGVAESMRKQVNIKYTPDFMFTRTLDNKEVVIEVKSEGTKRARDYSLRKRMFLDKFQDLIFIEWES